MEKRQPVNLCRNFGLLLLWEISLQMHDLLRGSVIQ